MRMTYSI